MQRRFHHRDYPADRLAAERDCTISVVIPARDEAATIAPIVRSVVALRDAGLVDQVVVVDDSQDGTAQLAADAGAEVYDQSSLRADFGGVRGKGDAMWRALSVLSGDLVVFLDADTEDFSPHFVTGLLGPLLRGDGRTRFVKATYDRPWRTAAARSRRAAVASPSSPHARCCGAAFPRSRHPSAVGRRDRSDP